MPRWLPTRRTGLRSNRGQVLALYALAVPVLLAIVALALDGGKLFVYHIHLQNAADAASLASAQDLGPCWQGTCTPLEQAPVLQKVKDDVNCYARNNNAPVGNCGAPPWQYPEMQPCNNAWDRETAAQRSGDMNCFTWPYDTTFSGGQLNWGKVEVRLRRTVSLSFGGLPGIPSTSHPSARAVATFQPDVQPGSPGSPAQTLTDPDVTAPGTVYTFTTVVNGTTTVLPTTTPGATHTTTDVTGGNCQPGGNCGVAFAKSEACPAITYNGAGGGSIGSLMTNGGFSSNGVGSGGKTINTLFLGKKGQAGCFDNQAGVVFTNPVVGPFSPQNWPIQPPTEPTHIPLGQRPLGGNECWDLGANAFTSGNAATDKGPGVYCSTVAVSLSQGANGYTFFAPCISVSGNGGVYRYSPIFQGARGQTLFYASGTDASCTPPGAPTPTLAMSMQGQNNQFFGDVFAPAGGISWRGGGVTGGTGFMEAQTFNIQGNFASYQGTGPLQGGTIVVHVTTDPSTTNYSTTVVGGVTTGLITTSPPTVITGQTVTIPSTPSTPDSTIGTTLGLGE
jgi:Putative Flp pilus-assembly TadE/G-like